MSEKKEPAPAPAADAAGTGAAAPVVSTGPGPGTVMVDDPKKNKPAAPSSGPGPGSIMYEDPSQAPARPDGTADAAPVREKGSPLIGDKPKPFHPDPDGMPVEKRLSASWSEDKKKVELKILLAVPPARVFKAVSDAGELTRWFCRSAEVEAKEGGRYAVGFKPGKTADWKILKFQKDQSLTVARPETVAFSVSAEGAKTLLKLSAQLPEDLEQSSSEQMLWSSHLLYLKAWLENGVDLRENDSALTWKDGYVNGAEPA